MLFVGIVIGVWIGAPLGALMIGMLGPREEGQVDPRGMQNLLTRHYPTAPDGDAGLDDVAADEPGRRRA